MSHNVYEVALKRTPSYRCETRRNRKETCADRFETSCVSTSEQLLNFPLPVITCVHERRRRAVQSASAVEAESLRRGRSKMSSHPSRDQSVRSWTGGPHWTNRLGSAGS